MIVFRYFTREILYTTFAVTSVLLLIITSARMIKYLSDAAAGKIDATAVFLVLFYRLPSFLELLLPLGLFLGILLSLGRLCIDSEMVVLRATGFTPNRILKSTFGALFVIAVMVANLSLWLSPLSLQKAEALLAEQEARSEFELITPGRFLNVSGRAIYSEQVESQLLNNVFVSEREDNGTQIFLVADAARRIVDSQTQQVFVVLENGYRYDVMPGKADATEIKYQEYAFAFNTPGMEVEVSEIDAQSTVVLMQSQERDALAALNWRISLPFMVLVVTLLAVPLSDTNPRQGRYAKLIPAILLYLIYMTLLMSMRARIVDGGSVLFLWLVHFVFVMLAVSFLYYSKLWEKALNAVQLLMSKIMTGRSAA